LETVTASFSLYTFAIAANPIPSERSGREHDATSYSRGKGCKNLGVTP